MAGEAGEMRAGAGSKRSEREVSRGAVKSFDATFLATQRSTYSLLAPIIFYN